MRLRNPGLEREDGSCFFTNIVPLAGGNASEGADRAWVAVSGVERLLEGEGRPTIELIVERANQHGAVAILQGCLLQIAPFGLVYSVKPVERPAGVAARGVGVEKARQRNAELSEPALRPHWTLRSEHQRPAGGCGRAKDDAGQTERSAASTSLTATVLYRPLVSL